MSDQGKMFLKKAQLEMLSKPLEQESIEKSEKEAERAKERQRYVEILRQKLPELKKMEGFPIGKDEDILALSDPPYYTACPNPFIEEFIQKYGKPYDEATDDYQREPFAADVSEGKIDPIFNAHSYHTKVPYKAIMRYILHYTEPGDIVFDGFCGTGMTGVAVQMCNRPDASFKAKIESEMPGIKWGTRQAILCDLCPSATFIAYNYNTSIDVKHFENVAMKILEEVEQECGWMYETTHNDGKTKGTINYTVWSDVFICSQCSREVLLWDAAVDHKTGDVQDKFNCPHCGALCSKQNMEKAYMTKFDSVLGESVLKPKQLPVLINYFLGNKQYIREPNDADLATVQKVEDSNLPYSFPAYAMMFKGSEWGDSWRAGYHFGVTHNHHFYTKRNLWTLSCLRDKVQKNRDDRIRRALGFLISSFDPSFVSKLTRYNFGKRGNSPLSGTLYIPSFRTERNISYVYRNKLDDIVKALGALQSEPGRYVLQTCSSSSILPNANNCIDYIFTDPPFGSNLMYSELNFIWEAWLRVFTNTEPEAIINDSQKKGLAEYQRLMEQCFKENYRILKPGRWMTVEFHNSQNSVWNAIQEAISRAGFVIADVRTLDKQQGSFKQVTSTQAVKQDLIISAYKPNGGLEQRFKMTAGTEDGAWEFVRQHLKHVPIFVDKDKRAEVITERQNYLLYDRMVAFHVQRGISVPISAGDFYAGLKEHFPERDDMYFLPDQVAEYDSKKLTVEGMEQPSLFVSDERSAVQWLRQQLAGKPRTYQDIQPLFLKELHQAGHEKLPELSELIEQNFLEDEQNLWYVPDPNKQGDLEKLRERDLLREFAEYRNSRGKLKVFRTEAIRAGFKQCWSARDYSTIIEVSRRLPESVLEEDSNLLMYYDNASIRNIEKLSMFDRGAA